MIAVARYYFIKNPSINYTKDVPSDVIRLIFQHLDVVDLLTCGRVDRRWRALALGSVEMRFPQQLRQTLKPFLERREISPFDFPKYLRIFRFLNWKQAAYNASHLHGYSSISNFINKSFVHNDCLYAQLPESVDFQGKLCDIIKWDLNTGDVLKTWLSAAGLKLTSFASYLGPNKYYMTDYFTATDGILILQYSTSEKRILEIFPEDQPSARLVTEAPSWFFPFNVQLYSRRGLFIAARRGIALFALDQYKSPSKPYFKGMNLEWDPIIDMKVQDHILYGITKYEIFAFSIQLYQTASGISKLLDSVVFNLGTNDRNIEMIDNLMIIVSNKHTNASKTEIFDWNTRTVVQTFYNQISFEEIVPMIFVLREKPKLQPIP